MVVIISYYKHNRYEFC